MGENENKRIDKCNRVILMKTVIISGACGGIGISTVKKFIKEGWQVIGLDKIKCIDIDKEIYKTQNEAIFYQVDLTDEKSVKEVRRDIISRGIMKIDAIVNLVGHFKNNNIYNCSVEEWTEIINNNLLSVFIAIKTFIDLLQSGGSIVNISSVDAFYPQKDTLAYSTSKGAVISLTKALARDLGDKGIRVNCIALGSIMTPPLARYIKEKSKILGKSEDKIEKELSDLHALKRIGRPEEVAELVYFLASELSSFMTGAIVIYDGGLSIMNMA